MPTSKPIPYRLGGRLYPRENKFIHNDLVQLPHARMAFVLQRLSTTEQKKNSLYSLERQDALEDMAITDGYQASLTKEEIRIIRTSSRYPGHYVNGQIVVEQRDLGLSGTLGQEDRPGLAHLIQMIEDDQVESVYVVEISRISRDQTLISGLAFGELCRAHHVVIVTPVMRLNLNNEMHMRIYRYEVDRAAEELKSIKFRLHGARDMKAKHGYYAGGSVPPGYVIDVDEVVDGKKNPNYHKNKIWEPHAEVVRLLFELMNRQGATPKKVAVHCKEAGIVFPLFPEEIATVRANMTSFAQTDQNPDGSYPITLKRVSCIVQNPAYIGWWVWGGQLLSEENHQPIIDAETFWAVQDKFSTKPRPQRGQPLLLSGLLYCGKHQPPRYMIHNRSTDPKRGARYHCHDTDYEENCLAISAHILDQPMAELVLSKCQFPAVTQEVLECLSQEYEQAKAKADAHQREYRRLAKEVANLKENLARTRTPEQVDMILEMIEQRMAEQEALGRVEN